MNKAMNPHHPPGISLESSLESVWLPLTPSEASGRDDDLGKGKWVAVKSDKKKAGSSSSLAIISNNNSNYNPSAPSSSTSSSSYPSTTISSSPSPTSGVYPPSSSVPHTSPTPSPHNLSHGIILERPHSNSPQKTLASSPSTPSLSPHALPPGLLNTTYTNARRSSTPLKTSTEAHHDGSSITPEGRTLVTESPSWTPLVSPATTKKSKGAGGSLITMRPHHSSSGNLMSSSHDAAGGNCSRPSKPPRRNRVLSARTDQEEEELERKEAEGVRAEGRAQFGQFKSQSTTALYWKKVNQSR